MKKKRRGSTAIIPGDLGYFKQHLGYYSQMKKLLEAKNTQVHLLTHRRKAIQDSNVLNYQNEFNRIQGLLENQNPGLHGRSRQSLTQRADELKRLGAEAVEGIVLKYIMVLYKWQHSQLIQRV